MATLDYEGDRFALIGEETVLDGLLRRGHEVAHACRSGVCQACTMICQAGESGVALWPYSPRSLERTTDT